MTSCKHIQPRLTAYLDGELADADGSVVRGHLRECAECREAARAEAALRDGLRQLPPVDPPAALWAGVQARLAAAEVADAHQPWWRRLARRWTPVMPSLRQLAAGTALAAAAVVALSIRARHHDDSIEAPAPAVAIAPAVAPTLAARSTEPARDVTAELAAEPARTTASYGDVVEELMKLATEARPGWSSERRQAFDGQLAELRIAYTKAAPGRAQQRVQRSMIRALQHALVHDDVLLASGGAR